MNKALFQLILTAVLFLTGTYFTNAQDGSDDSCPCFTREEILELAEDPAPCSFNIFKVEYSPDNTFFNTDYLARCDGCAYGTADCMCSVKKVGDDDPTSTGNLIKTEFESCQTLVIEAIMMFSSNCTVSSE